MTQPIRLASLAPSPSAGYEQPFEMLEACHERVQRMLRLLARLREHLARHGADEQARQAARDVMRYFDQAAPQHHLDEERHVFPPLLACGDPAVVAVVQQLQADHRAMEARWALARQVLEAVVAGTGGVPDASQDTQLAAFATLYDAHIAQEEGVAYPAARQSLGADALEAMADDMMRRRGVR